MVCRDCQKRSLCTSSLGQRATVIERSQYQDFVDRNNMRVRNEVEKYRQRQMMSVHPFGVVKRQWGYDHLLMKGLRKTDSEISLIYLCYNLKRIMNIRGIKGLKEAIKAFCRNINTRFCLEIFQLDEKRVILMSHHSF